MSKEQLPRRPPAKMAYPVLEREIGKRYKRFKLVIACTLDMDYYTFTSQLAKGNIRIQDAIKIQEKFFSNIPIKELFTIEERI